MMLTCLLSSASMAFGDSTEAPAKPAAKRLSFHFQQTVVYQWQPGVPGKAGTFGTNSLSHNAEDAQSLTTTLFVSHTLWKNAKFTFNPELAGGSGLSFARGAAGFPNGETFRIGNPAPQVYIARAFYEQRFPLSKQREMTEDDFNVIAKNEPVEYISVCAGKFSLADYFDVNTYSHDPRTQFLNWSLMSHGAWDYAANTRGYTFGVVLQLVKKTYSLRYAAALVPTYANGPKLEADVNKYSSHNVEIERRYLLGNRKGAVRLLFYYNLANMGSYSAAIADTVHDIIRTRISSPRSKYGFGLNIEQELTSTVGFFFRASWNDGANETWAFTEIDRSTSGGLLISGHRWKRPDDALGIAFVVNGISDLHRQYLAAGGYGFMIGDGSLSYGHEAIAEVFYKMLIHEDHFWISPDYQLIINPAYNKNHGPANIFGVRMHAEF